MAESKPAHAKVKVIGMRCIVIRSKYIAEERAAFLKYLVQESRRIALAFPACSDGNIFSSRHSKSCDIQRVGGGVLA